MVLAKKWSKGKEERKRSNAKMRAWAKETGIPEDKLPLAPEDE